MSHAQREAETARPFGIREPKPRAARPDVRVQVVRASPAPPGAGKKPAAADESAPVPVEFTGWLPVFSNFGNCGHHPQFTHTESPPPGYRFIRSGGDKPRRDERPNSSAARVAAALGLFAFALASIFRPLASVVRHSLRHGPWKPLALALFVFGQFCRMLLRGARPWPLIRFLRSRHFPSQVLLPRGNELVFLTSIPYTYGQDPWVIEIEDSTTLFYPFLRNGETHDVPVRRSPFFPMVKALLESDRCRGVVTHVRSTADSLPVLFGSDTIARKTFHVPLGVKAPARWQTHAGDGPINLLFTCSWHQDPQSFFLRGGLDVLEAFSLLRERYPNLRLTLRTGLPQMQECYHRMVEQGWVRIISRFLSEAEMEELLRETHIFLLPAARIHIVSLLRAMAFGQVVVASDGWGFDEYVRHGDNGLLVPGRYGKASWMDPEAGVLREDYRPMRRSDPLVVAGLVRELSRLAEDRALRRRLGARARADVQAHYNLDRWNAGLKAVFDRAVGRG